jgi:hypothetical protein
MLGLRRTLSLVVLSTAACGGAAKPAAAPAAAPVAPAVAPAPDAPDLSPVAAPAGLVGVGRLSRPLALGENVARWAGLPVSLRQLLPERLKDLDSAIAWDAPVEFAVVLSDKLSRDPLGAVITVGVSSERAALDVAQARGFAVERLSGGIYSVETGTAHCALAPALGSVKTRFVCGSRRSALNELLPYATRGLPNEKLGTHDLEVEFRAQPVRDRFGQQLGSARLLAGMLVRQFALDDQRFDRAFSDAAYATADELVALVQELDTLHLQGSLDDTKREVSLELTLRFNAKKSWVANLFAESQKHNGPAPAAFWKLPADSTSGGYAYGLGAAPFDAIQASLAEITDAFLEYEKVGKATRGRARRVLDAYFLATAGSRVTGEGTSSDLATAKPGEGGFMLSRVDAPAAKLREALSDLQALINDPSFRKLLARRTRLEEKLLPTAKLAPLNGAGVPAGTRALTITVRPELKARMQKMLMRGKDQTSSEAGAPATHVIAIIPDETGSVVGMAGTQKELALRLGSYASGKGPTLAEQKELTELRSLSVNAAQFTTLLSLYARFLDPAPAEVGKLSSTLPNQGRAPILGTYAAEGAGPVTGRIRFRVPSGVFEDLPAALPALMTPKAASGVLEKR